MRGPWAPILPPGCDRSPMAHDILSVDDDAAIPRPIAGELHDERYATREAADPTDGRGAATGSRVVDTGAPGSGKEVVARLLHTRSRRSEGPVVPLNCATMRPDRLEIELFGSESVDNGAPRKIGTFERAHGGTLFLDE